MACQYLLNFYKLGLADLEQIFYHYLVYAGRIWITSAEGATAPETLRQHKIWREVSKNARRRDNDLRQKDRGASLTGYTTRK